MWWLRMNIIKCNWNNNYLEWRLCSQLVVIINPKRLFYSFIVNCMHFSIVEGLFVFVSRQNFRYDISMCHCDTNVKVYMKSLL